jgi:hypothetical protein
MSEYDVDDMCSANDFFGDDDEDCRCEIESQKAMMTMLEAITDAVKARLYG